MKYRLLGKTSLLVSEVSCGGIPVQKLNEEETKKLVDCLEENGVNFIDTARGYTVSEALFGYALEGRRKKFYLATKSMARTYDAMKKDIEISLNNLRTDYIDLYQMHNVKMSDDVSGALMALREAKAEGKVKHIGITCHSLESVNKWLESDDIETIQFPYNFLETDAEKVFEKASRLNKGVIVMKPLAGGVIDNAKVSLKFILNNENVSVCIPGMESKEQIIENTSIDNYNLNDDEKEYINSMREKMDKDFCHRCGYCLPCTKGIDIPSCFMFYGYYERYGLGNWAESRYNTMKIKASECIECGLCEQKCPYNLKIIEKLKKVVEAFENGKDE